MTKTKSGKKGLIIGLVLTLIFAIILSVEIYIFFCVDTVNSNRDLVIRYDNLQKTTTDTMLYLSDDFLYENDLDIAPVYAYIYHSQTNGFYNEYLGDVVLEYDTNKISTGFNRNIIKTDLYRYDLVSNSDNEDIPITVNVVGAVGANNKHKYNKEVGNGDKYAVLDSELATYFNGIGKSYEIKGQVGKVGLIKKYSRLKITVTVDAQNINDYTKEQIEERVDAVLASALEYVQRYGE
ncbi:MAG: hypothetical protein K2K85_03445 [Clostridia bacterium]|nr:hypothetical protein [Clostridia bacterium]